MTLEEWMARKEAETRLKKIQSKVETSRKRGARRTLIELSELEQLIATAKESL